MHPCYKIINFRNGFEDNWTYIQNNVFGPHKRREFDQIFHSNSEKEGIFFMFSGDNPVGISAGIIKLTEKGNKYGVLDWVGVLTGHRRKGIGKALSIMALNHLKNNGLDYASLRTPVYRKVAVNMYLELGFKIIFEGNRTNALKMQIIRADSSN